MTSHAAIEAAAFRLFAAKGFDDTTLDDIAEAVGVGRRTLFRYFPSKNDIPWGQFDQSLSAFREALDATPDDVPVVDAVQRAVVEFNRFDPDAIAQHRLRMTLILGTPTLQAHSVLRYQQWREVISGYVSKRLGIDGDLLLPKTVGHVSLALALSAYEQWLETGDRTLDELLTAAMSALREYVAEEA